MGRAEATTVVGNMSWKLVLALLFATGVYLILGGAIFWAVESGPEERNVENQLTLDDLTKDFLGEAITV